MSDPSEALVSQKVANTVQMAALDADLCQVGADGYVLAGLLGEDRL